MNVITGTETVCTTSNTRRAAEEIHNESLLDKIEGLNTNPDGLGVVLDVSTSAYSSSVYHWHIVSVISFGVPAEVYAMLPGRRARFLPADFTET